MKILFIITLLALNVSLFAQDTPESAFEKLFEEGKYSEIISKSKSLNEEDFSPKAFYYIGISYYDDKNYETAISFFDKAIKGGDNSAKTYFYRGLSYDKKGEPVLALENIDMAIELSPEISYFYSEKAAILLDNGKKDEAVLLLSKAIDMDNPDGLSYFLLTNMLYKDNKPEEALRILKNGIQSVKEDDEYFILLIYNASLIDFDMGNFLDSKNAAFKLLELNPNAFIIIPVIIQNYFSLDNLDSASVFQDKLYSLHNENKLDEDLKDEYCFERFNWEEYKVHGYESFEELDNSEYQRLHKQVYKFFDSNYDVKFTIQTERFNTFGMGELDFDYVMGMSIYEGETFSHRTYGTLTLKDPVDYRQLKKNLLKILNEEVSPTTSSKSKSE